MIKGDLLAMAEAGKFDVIVQGCNCFNTMGSGIARSIREKWPQAYEADCTTLSGDKEKLGTFTMAVARVADNKILGILNAYTQFGFNKPGESNDVFEYEAFQKFLNTIADALVLGDQAISVGFPLIGCGLAGGDKTRILAMIEEFSQKITTVNGTVTVVEFG